MKIGQNQDLRDNKVIIDKTIDKIINKTIMCQAIQISTRNEACRIGATQREKNGSDFETNNF